MIFIEERWKEEKKYCKERHKKESIISISQENDNDSSRHPKCVTSASISDQNMVLWEYFFFPFFSFFFYKNIPSPYLNGPIDHGSAMQVNPLREDK